MSWTDFVRGHATVTTWLAVGLGTIVLWAVARGVFHAWRYGARAYLGSLFRIDPDNAYLFAVLIIVALGMMLMFIRGAG